MSNLTILAHIMNAIIKCLISTWWCIFRWNSSWWASYAGISDQEKRDSSQGRKCIGVIRGRRKFKKNGHMVADDRRQGCWNHRASLNMREEEVGDERWPGRQLRDLGWITGLGLGKEIVQCFTNISSFLFSYWYRSSVSSFSYWYIINISKYHFSPSDFVYSITDVGLCVFQNCISSLFCSFSLTIIIIV